MSRRHSFLLILTLLCLMASCGKKGPIELPLLRVPQAVGDLAAFQRGSTCLLTWTNPSAYVDGSPLGEIAELEIWLIKEDRGTEGARTTWTAAAFADKAELLGRISQEELASLRREGAKTAAELTYRYALAGDDMGKKVFTFSLRVSDLKKRASQFAAPVSLEALAPLAPPRSVQAVVFEDHIRVSWEGQEPAQEEAALVMIPVIIPLITPPMNVPVTPPTTPSTTPVPSAGFNIYRSEGDSPAIRENPSLLETSEFLDKDFLFGRTYRYFVRAALESKPPLESDDSEAVEVVTKDVFPPAPPSGLTAISGPGFIALSWEGGREPDLAGYRIWRRPAGEGEFTPVATLTQAESSYSDLKVEKNRGYEYAITALDAAGNESPKSAAATGIVRDEPFQ